MKKRTFLKTIGFGSIQLPLMSLSPPAWAQKPKKGESFWKQIRADYDLKPEYTNLESGYYNIIPQPTLKALQNQIAMINREGSYYMRTVRLDNKQKVINQLADVVGCDASNLILTRNTTESLNTVIKGMSWQKGDHVIYSEQEYGAMQQMILQVALENQLNTTILSIPKDPKNDDEIVSLYKKAIQPETKLILVSHMINITGHILPIKKICDMAHASGVQVLVDGAHCVGHFTFSIESLDCDYYGSSLHKWLAAPLGCGMLYINPKHHNSLSPLFAENVSLKNTIKRYGHIGTHPEYHDLAILNAIDYLQLIEPKRKEKRLRYLTEYWTKSFKNHPNIYLETPSDTKRFCGIATVGLKNVAPPDLASLLLHKHKIFTVAINNSNVRGCRITPNIFTTLEELDQLIFALNTIDQEASKT